MKYTKADYEHVVDAADFFTFLGYKINIGAVKIHFPHLTNSAVTLYK